MDGAQGLSLPHGRGGIAATVRAGDEAEPVADVRVTVAAVMEDARGRSLSSTSGTRLRTGRPRTWPGH